MDDLTNEELATKMDDLAAIFIGHDRALFMQVAKRLREHDQSFNLRWNASMRAIERWRAEKPEARELHQPDHADLCVWLMGQIDEIQRAWNDWMMANTFGRTEAEEVLNKAIHGPPT